MAEFIKIADCLKMFWDAISQQPWANLVPVKVLSPYKLELTINNKKYYVFVWKEWIDHEGIDGGVSMNEFFVKDEEENYYDRVQMWDLQINSCIKMFENLLFHKE